MHPAKNKNHAFGMVFIFIKRICQSGVEPTVISRSAAGRKA